MSLDTDDVVYAIRDVPSNVYAYIANDVKGSGIKHDDNFMYKLENLYVHPRFAQLLTPVAAAHPDWHIRMRIGMWFGGRAIDGLEVYCVDARLGGDEKIGTLEYNHSTDKYAISSRSIRNDLGRGTSRKTGDISKAIRYAETMAPKSCGDIIYERKQKIISRMESGIYSQHHKYNQPLSTVMRLIERAIEKCPSLLRSMDKIPIAETSIAELETNLDEYEAVKAIKEGKGYFVTIYKGMYVVKPSDKDETVKDYWVFQSNDVPPHIRKGIGMLKLVDERSFVRGVGYKSDENDFFILREQANEESKA